MKNPRQVLIAQILLVVALISAIGFAARHAPLTHSLPVDQESLPAGAAATNATTTADTSVTVPEKSVATTTPKAKKPIIKATESPSAAATSSDEIKRIDHPYTTEQLASTVVNQRARAAIVNILCTNSSGLVRPISGSGVMIDPRGVILTNAHVAQYVLLSESPRVNLQCYVRTGSPAVARWIPKVMYVPEAWIAAHASELKSDHAIGTGEHDYALLSLAASVDGSPVPDTLPYLPVDTREGVAFVDDPVLVASYPAEFLGAIAATYNLYAVSSPTTIRKMLTFSTDLVDALSLGGVIAAQSGSSGGAVVNGWGYMVGLIATMSEGSTTEDRDLRAISLSYIDRDLKQQLGINLDSVLDTDPSVRTADFSKRGAPKLIELLLKTLGI